MNEYKVENIPCYQASKKLAATIYPIVRKWDFLDQKTIGVQLIRSVDSVAANIAEGFGRFHKKDKIKFFYNARGSAFESTHWIQTAFERKLLSSSVYDHLNNDLQELPKQINYLIKITQNNLTI